MVYNPAPVTVTAAGTTSTVAVGSTRTFAVAGGEVDITVNQPTVNESADGRSATGTVSVVTATVRVGPALAPLATATVDLLPLRASAVSPAGGIDCRPALPVLTNPAENSDTTDTTPTFTGTAVPGAQVEIFVAGRSIGITTAGPDGGFSFTPTTPLALGTQTATAVQTTAAGTSAGSNANIFTILVEHPGPPVLTAPADGSTTSDTTPTFTGTAVPGAQVEIFVAGRSIGFATAGPDGGFSFTPTTPLALGTRTATAEQTNVGGISARSNANRFTIRAVAPAPPVLTAPADGSVTSDTTPTFTGTAVPGALLTIVVDGRSIGTTTARPDGMFSFTPTTPLALGTRTATAVQTTAGGTSASSNANDFTIRAVAPAAPVLTAPADGSVTSDTTPTFTGTAVPGALVTIVVDGRSIGTTTARPDGTFSFTPTTPLALGTRTATAVQTTAGGTSAASNANDFTIRAVAPAAPVLTAPADGSATTDRTPVVRGTGQGGATVAVSIDGVPVGTAVVGADGEFSVPVTDPLNPGPHTVTAVQTDRAGNTSPADSVEVAVTVVPRDNATAPPVPVVIVPVDGSSTNPVRPIVGVAQPEAARGALADTGGPVAWVSVLAGLSLMGGVALLVAQRRRRQRVR